MIGKEKMLRDYLHLYLGIKCKVGTKMADRSIRDDGEMILDEKRLYNWSKGHEVLDIILRPLASMTDAEKCEFAELQNYTYHSVSDKIGTTNNILKSGEFNPISTKYLLSKGFDLFGLIEEKLAVRE